jgi:Cys-tRNA(Pro)/Cys-tRNA(Cys) deacylase
MPPVSVLGFARPLVRGKAWLTPAVRAARAAGIAFRRVEVDPDIADMRAPAAVLGVRPESIFKTLIARVGGATLVVALLPAVCELDPKALADLAGGERASLASPDEAERSSGYALGAISPLGQRSRLATFVDASAQQLAQVYVSGGRRGLELELSPSALVQLCNARVGRSARSDG